MKTGVLSFLLHFLPIVVLSQQPVPEEASAFHQKAMVQINAKHVMWIKKTAIEVNQKKMNETEVNGLVKKYGDLSGLRSPEVEGLTSLLLTESSVRVYGDIYRMVLQMEDQRKRKAAIGNALQSINALYATKGAAQRKMPRYEYDSLSDLKKDIPVKDPKGPVAVQRPGRENPTKNTSEVTEAEIKQLSKDLSEKKDTLSALSEEMSLRIQQYQERYTKFLNSLSVLIRKNSETQDNIIQNLK